MLRWELHKRKGPSVDSAGHVHTITQTFSATVRGDQSLLRKCLEAHLIDIPEGGVTDSTRWLGHAAWIDVGWSDDEKYANVEGFSRLDEEEDALPTKQLHFEHWEPEDAGAGKSPPQWAGWAIARSSDLAHLAAKKPGAPAANGTPARATAPVGAPADVDDIPF
jgi:hypothetical protein